MLNTLGSEGPRTGSNFINPEWQLIVLTLKGFAIDPFPPKFFLPHKTHGTGALAAASR
jgi:hypothetical protein